MLNKYLKFLRQLSESVFEIKNLGSLSDYFEAVWRGFLLLFLVIVSIAGIAAVIIAPFILWSKVWVRLTKKITNEINQLFNEGKHENNAKIFALQKKLRNIKMVYGSALSFLHLPFILPLILMLLDVVF